MKNIESLVEELYSISAALKFLGVCLDDSSPDCDETAGSGSGYISSVLGDRVYRLAEKCWDLKKMDSPDSN
jgi:hypothetical protein